MNALRREAAVALAIARKDALAELRGRHAVVGTLFFAAVVLLLFGFALGPDSARLAAAAPGLLWLAIVLSGLLAVNRLHLLEADDGALDQLTLYPVARRAIYAGKALGGFAVMLALGVVVLGAVGIAAVGTFYAGLTVRLRAREVMLPLLMLPVLAPLLLAAVKATSAALAGDPLGELGSWLQLLVAFDIIMVVAGAATYAYVLED